MAKIVVSGGNTGSGGTTILPGVDGSVPVSVDGEWVVGIANEPQVKNLVASETIDSGSVAAGAVTITENGDTSQLTATSLAMGAVEMTDVQLGGIDAAPTMSAANPPILTDNPALSDARDPRAHSGMDIDGIPTAHIGMSAWDTQVRIAPADFSDTLDGITGDEPTLNDALLVLDSHGHPEADVTFDASFGHAHTGTGSKQIAYGNISGTPSVPTADTLIPGGRLYVPPAFISTATDQAIPLTSANHKIALGFTPEVDFALSSLSVFVTAISSTGDMAIDLCADGAAIEPQGELCSDPNKVLSITMTTNTAPSPYVFGCWDKNAANAEAAGYEAYRLSDGVLTANTGCRSNAAPTGADPIYWSIDLGAGGEKAINRWVFVPSAALEGYPKAFTFWASNVASPTMNTDTDWVQLTGRAAWTAETYGAGSGNVERLRYCVQNATAYRHYRWKFTDRNGTAAYVCVAELYLYEAESKPAPGTVLQSLGTLAAGSSADVWLRTTFAAYQLYQGIDYWLQFTGQDTKSFSLSVRAENAAANSMFPDTCKTKHTTDGASWLFTHQLNTLYRPAMLNVILNSTTHHCPSLMYGRHKGSQVSLYESSAWALHSIPAAGISLDCEALTALTKYGVFLYDNTGTLTLEAVSTARVLQDGIEVKSGATSHRFLGIMGALALQTTYQGPLDCPDARLLRNRYNAKSKSLRRNPNYVGATTYIAYEMAWLRTLRNNDFMSYVVTWKEEAQAQAVIWSVGYATYLGLAIDGETPLPDNCISNDGNNTNSNLCLVPLHTVMRFTEGFHTVYMVNRSQHTTSGSYALVQGTPIEQCANYQMAIDC